MNDHLGLESGAPEINRDILKNKGGEQLTQKGKGVRIKERFLSKGVKMKKILSVSLFLASVLFIFALNGNAASIPIGGIWDITGPTGDVGAPYATAQRNYISYVNSHGGINGKKIALFGEDYAYKIPAAVALYKRLTEKHVLAILGWGTGDTEALSRFIARDKIPYISASYSEGLSNVKKAPYNFPGAVTYSDQARIALAFIKSHYKGSGNPKVALLYNVKGFGRSPINDAKKYAKKIGVNIVDDEIVPLRALDVTSQLLSMKKHGAQYALIQETIMATSTILKDAKKLGIKTKFFALNWAANEKLLALAGSAAEGLYWTSPFSLWTDTNLKGIRFVHKVSKLYNGNRAQLVNYIQGFIAAYTLVQALKKADKEGRLNGPGIKYALEHNKFPNGGLSAPASYSPKLHKFATKLRIYQVQNGKFVPVTGYISP